MHFVLFVERKAIHNTNTHMHKHTLQKRQSALSGTNFNSKILVLVHNRVGILACCCRCCWCFHRDERGGVGVGGGGRVEPITNKTVIIDSPRNPYAPPPSSHCGCFQTEMPNSVHMPTVHIERERELFFMVSRRGRTSVLDPGMSRTFSVSLCCWQPETRSNIINDLWNKIRLGKQDGSLELAKNINWDFVSGTPG
jgi:hypothetical protein